MKNIQIALIIALLLCLFPMPYGFYIFVRFYSFIVFSLMAYQCYHNDKSNNALLWGSLALLFQPFLKITLGREIWNIIDVIVAILIVIFLLRDTTVQ